MVDRSSPAIILRLSNVTICQYIESSGIPSKVYYRNILDIGMVIQQNGYIMQIDGTLEVPW